ncbi:MAG: ECF transporter S component [Negativicutes bacterium]|nr:ECF transporter S component [Negativicutes bacterium]
MMTTKTLTTTAAAAALTALAITVLQVPSPVGGGYYHLGEIVMMSAACLYGRLIGATAAGLGSALADLLSGYAVWAPVSLIVHGGEGYLIAALDGGSRSYGRRLLALTVGALFMVAGYWLAEWGMFGQAAAVAEIPGNLVQGAIGVAGAMAVLRSLAALKIGAGKGRKRV